MRAPYRFIVETENRYNNKVDVDGSELIINTEITERDYQFVNRIGKVVATPIAIQTPIRAGDDIIVHHNVFRQYYDMKNRLKQSSNYISENQFQVQLDQIFGYRRDKKWEAAPGYCFVAPILEDDKWSTETYKKLMGEVKISNNYLESLGITLGTIVGFKPDSEYEFDIEGQLLYRILSNNITIDYGYKKEERIDTEGIRELY